MVAPAGDPAGERDGPAGVARRAACRRRACGSLETVLRDDDLRSQVRRRAASRSAGSAGTWSPLRMSLTSCGRRPAPGTTRTGCRAARRSGSACRTSARPARPRWRCPAAAAPAAIGVAAARASSSGSATSTADGHRPRAGEHAALQQRHQQPGDAERDADAGVGDLAVGGQRVVAAARADRAERLVAVHPGLEHRAGVVVQAAGDAQVGLDPERSVEMPRAARDHRGELGQTLRRAGRARRPSACTRGDERGVRRMRISASAQALLGLLAGRGRPRRPAAAHDLGRAPCRACRSTRMTAAEVGRPEAPVEALDQPAVVDLQPQRRQEFQRRRAPRP